MVVHRDRGDVGSNLRDYACDFVAEYGGRWIVHLGRHLHVITAAEARRTNLNSYFVPCWLSELEVFLDPAPSKFANNHCAHVSVLLRVWKCGQIIMSGSC